MNAVKAIGGAALGIAVFIGLIFLSIFVIKGAAYVSVVALPFLDFAATVSFLICLFLLLPLAMFRSTRMIACVGFYIASAVFGIELWMYAFIVTYTLWGWIGVIVGLGFGGVGIIPLGIIAAALHGQWWPVAQLIFGLVTTIGASGLTAYLAAKIEQAQSTARLSAAA